MMRQRWLPMVALTVIAIGSPSSVVKAQDVGLEPGERLRVKTRVYSNDVTRGGMRTIAEGYFQALRGDSLYLTTKGPRQLVAFPTSVLASPQYSVEVRVGSSAGRGALGGALALGASGFLLGFCGGGEDCDRDWGVGFKAGGVLSVIGGGLGFLIGALVDHYEPIG